MKIEPYLNFDGRCDEAIEFYRKAVGAQVLMLMRFKESPEKPPPGMSPPSEDKVMHAALKIGETTVMASDGRCTGKSQFSGVTLSLSVKDAQEAQRIFAALSADGGKVHMPLAKTFFSPSFGMLADRFGVMWMVLVPQA